MSPGFANGFIGGVKQGLNYIEAGNVPGPEIPIIDNSNIDSDYSSSIE